MDNLKVETGKGYDTDKLYKQAVKDIQEHKLYFDSDVYAYLGISKSTYYDHFPPNSDYSNSIKDYLRKNKVNTKVSLRNKMEVHKSASAIIALYKLIGTREERANLSDRTLVEADSKALEEFASSMSKIVSDRDEYEEPE